MDPLVAEAAAGSEPAWAKIVEIVGPALRGFARGRGAPEPDELVQEVFCDAARNIARFDGEWEQFRSWLFTIAYRRLTDMHRRAGRRPRTVPVFDRDAVDGRPDPEQLVVAEETTRELLARLDSLDPIARDVILLRVVGEFSAAEVAEIVGTTPGNVRVIQSRAIQRLRKEIRIHV